MVVKNQRVSTVLSMVSKLDIPPSMYKDAIEKYKNIATFLQDKGIESDFYPQGSFSLGTVVRPYKDNKDTCYDLDAICQIKIPKHQTSPQTIKEMVEEVLKDDERYKPKLTIHDTCITINYADKNGIGFSIDIVPAVEEDVAKKQSLQLQSPDPSIIQTSIAIPRKKSNEYNWATNNPKGLKSWFEKINKPFMESNPQLGRYDIFESNRAFFSSIEEIPEGLERSSLQRVIQILKRHRDVYFSKTPKDSAGNDMRPLSAIITTLVTSISESAPSSLSVLDLLKYVLDDLKIYSKRQVLNEASFEATYKNKNIIQRTSNGWRIDNPANPEDNLADSWNDIPTKATAFFRWIDFVTTDMLGITDRHDSEFVTLLESAFGSDFIRRNIDLSEYTNATIAPTPITSNSHSKPWSL